MASVVRTIRSGSLSLCIRQYADGRHGFDYTPPGEARSQVRLKTMEDAEARGRELLGAAEAGKVERLSIDPDEYAEFLRWKAARRPKAAVPALVEKFLRNKRDKGRSEWHLRTLKGDLELFAAVFTGPISDLRSDAVEAWLTARGIGARRWNNLLASIVALHRFARREQVLSAELTPVELIERHSHRPKIETYSPNEFARLLSAAGEDWLPALIFGGMCGLRPEEYRPDPRFGKPGLTWANVLWAKGKIDVTAEASKVQRRRFANLCESAARLLHRYRKRSGPVLPFERLTKHTALIAEAAGVPWKSNGLRHSYASYRLALTEDVPSLALEMGNSPAMIFAHYLDVKHREEAEEWFATVPKVPNSA